MQDLSLLLVPFIDFRNRSSWFNAQEIIERDTRSFQRLNLCIYSEDFLIFLAQLVSDTLEV